MYDTIRYSTIYLRALKSRRYGQLTLAHGTEINKIKEKLKTKPIKNTIRSKVKVLHRR